MTLPAPAPGRLRRLLRRRSVRWAGVALGGAAVLVNGLAWRQARAMTTFVGSGERTRAPQDLTRLERAAVLLTGVRVPRPEHDRAPADLGLASTTHGFAARDGTALEAWHLPAAGAPRGVVLLCHGYAASRASLLPIAAELVAAGWDALLLDLRGSGGSAGSTTTLGWHEAQDVAAGAALAGRLRPGLPLVVYGVSMGAAAALRAVAHEGLRPTGLVLECPFDRLSTTTRHRFEAMGLPPSPGAELLLFWGGVQQGTRPFAHDPVEYARAVTCPALLLVGDRDPFVAVGEVEAVRDALGSRRRDLVVFPGVGHASYLAADPAAWRGSVGRFLGSVGEGAPDGRGR